MKVLVVGGAEYIGSHIRKALEARGDAPIVFDNLSPGHRHTVRWGALVRRDTRTAPAFVVHVMDPADDCLASLGSLMAGTTEMIADPGTSHS